MKRVHRVSTPCVLLGALAVVATLLPLSALAADVSVRYEKVTIPTYEIGKGNPQPTLFAPDRNGAYPRSMYDVSKLPEKSVNVEYDLAVLENEFLRVEVLPSVGGRVWQIIDKRTGKNLLWTNDVIKPVNVGRRRGWIAGGIEFPFPVGNHGEDTFLPYRSNIRANSDGSATVTVSMFDHFYRFRASYDISLAPGEARVAIAPRLCNPTLVRNRYQLWINAAMPAKDDLQFIFPVDYVAGHGFGGVHPWPMWDDGRYDHSYWKNQRESLGVFGWDADFFGAYYHDADYGLIRYTPHTDAEGIKLWTWGTNSGWTSEYSLNQGPYVEIQSGRFRTQDMYGWLEPHQADTWTEYWMPVRNIGGVDIASKDAVATLEIISKAGVPESVSLKLNATRTLAGPLTIHMDGREVLKQEVSLTPADVLELSRAVPGATADSVFHLELRDKQGFVLLALDKPVTKKPAPAPEEPANVTVPGDTPEWKALARALEMELTDGNPRAARGAYGDITKAFPDFAPAWKALGILLYKQFDYADAEAALATAVEKAPDDPESTYYLGLARLAQGAPNATETLSAVSRDVGFMHAARFVIALEKLKAGDASAIADLRTLADGWSGDSILWNTIAAAERKRLGEAGEAITAALTADALDPVASVERILTAPTPSPDAVREALGVDDALYLDVALFYDSLGESAPALFVARAGADCASSGLYFYHLARLAGRAGDEAAAREYAAKASSLGVDYVFPSRAEDLAAFDAAVRLGASPGPLSYFRGVLFFWLGRTDDALALWQETVVKYKVPGLSRTIADAYSKGRISADVDAAISLYRSALEETPGDAESYYALDDLYQTGYNAMNFEERGRILEEARKLLPDDDEIALRLALFYAQRRRGADAAEILDTHKFRRAHQSYERSRLAVRAIEETYFRLAAQEQRSGSKEKAAEYLDRASRARELSRRWFD